MWCNLHHDSVVGNVLQSFLKQHGTEGVVDLVVGRKVLCQLCRPPRLWYRRTDPAFGTCTKVGNNLHSAPLLGRSALGAQRPIVVKLSRERSVGRSVGRFVGLSVGVSVCPVHCGKKADRIRMPLVS